MRGDAVGQRQEASEPVPAAPGKEGDVLPGVGPGDDGAQGHGDDVEEQVTLAAVDPGVFETAKGLRRAGADGAMILLREPRAIAEENRRAQPLTKSRSGQELGRLK